LAAETADRKATRKRQLKALASVTNEADKKASDAVAFERLKRALKAKPILAKSVREKATKEEVASWNTS
jgi:hypothetical protein